MEGVGAGVGEAYAWAVENADKVSCIYGENPVVRGTMVTKGNPDENAKVPHIDDLSPLAKAGVSILHVCGTRHAIAEGIIEGNDPGIIG